ncbi:pentapeptide repeat-containing protein [Chondrinema litorale]|uniref:pentapeptide repeat-containing protein n=1 Tax=Chondrinema litorale TaxID=2994555 RepID=UPI002543D188|nr:pentapeptide repeat-containing protein [Chondrinema litorale]UZR98131.1 pentapeptide repeat-containing protein [Chondrinema litorale]
MTILTYNITPTAKQVCKRFSLLIILSLFLQSAFAQFALNTNGRTFTGSVNYRYKSLFLIKCDSCVFEDEVDFKNATFTREAIFSNAIFKEDTKFEKVNFKAKGNFLNSTFSKKADFGYINTYSVLDFTNAIFNDEALFWMSNLSESVYFNSTVFKDDVVLLKSKINKAFFSNTSIMGEARFDNMYATDSLVFTNVKFTKMLNLDSAQLGTQLIFDSVSFNGIVRLRGTILPDILQLKNTNFELPLDFDKCIPNETGSCLLYLENVDVTNCWFNFQFMKLWFPHDSPLSSQQQTNLYKKLLALEKKRKRTESYEALKKQMDDFDNAPKEVY